MDRAGFHQAAGSERALKAKHASRDPFPANLRGLHLIKSPFFKGESGVHCPTILTRASRKRQKAAMSFARIIYRPV
jgi:hypothetical protein